MATSSSSEILSKSSQVFISCEVSELPTFFSNLKIALNLAGISYDKHMYDAKENLYLNFRSSCSRIKKSEIALTIFSKNYAESEFCLSELVEIMRLVEQGNLRMIPIYFDVTSEDIKKLMLQKFDLHRPTDQILGKFQWGIALDSASDFSKRSPLIKGIWTKCNETKLIGKIIKNVKKLLSIIPPPPPMDLSPPEQVFISCEVSEWPDLFSHLKETLKLAGISYFTYMDKDYKDRESHYHKICKRVSKSEIALTIFSRNYAESEWHLAELVEITRKTQHELLRMIPIYLNVTPKGIRKFMEEKFIHRRPKDQILGRSHWRDALDYASSRSSLHMGNRNEREFSVAIVKDVINRLKASGSFTDTPPQYQVFLNFRGEELRTSFISFLLKAMRWEKINVFIDSLMLRGTDLQYLFRKIEESRIAVVIFSERYTESCWCIDELVKINEQMKQENLRVIPVFYKLNATTCKRLEGTFGEKFRKLEWEYRSEPERIQDWKEALISICNKIGLQLNISRCGSDECEFIDVLVKDVKNVLSDIFTKEIENA